MYGVDCWPVNNRIFCDYFKQNFEYEDKIDCFPACEILLQYTPYYYAISHMKDPQRIERIL